jgi:hypothetical protein
MRERIRGWVSPSVTDRRDIVCIHENIIYNFILVGGRILARVDPPSHEQMSGSLSEVPVNNPNVLYVYYLGTYIDS